LELTDSEETDLENDEQDQQEEEEEQEGKCN
jgi:hypothetical protein